MPEKEDIRIETTISQDANMELANIAQRQGISKARLLREILLNYLYGDDDNTH